MEIDQALEKVAAGLQDHYLEVDYEMDKTVVEVMNELGQDKEEEAIEPITILLNRDASFNIDCFVRSEAMETLGKIGSHKTEEVLVKFALKEFTKTDTSWDAFQVLKKVGGTYTAITMQNVLENLNEYSCFVRIDAASILREIYHFHSKEILQRALRNTSNKKEKKQIHSSLLKWESIN